MRSFITFLCLIFFLSCENKNKQQEPSSNFTEPSLLVLGTLQDGGSPHIGCNKDCCKSLFKNPDPDRKVVSLGIIDPQSEQTFLIEAGPDLPSQFKELKEKSGFKTSEYPDAVFITHAHIGHYAGLMYLGREAMNAKAQTVYSMPRLKSFLETNGPWDQLVRLNNIQLRTLKADSEIVLSPQLKIKAFLVPHRDEYSETLGFIISGPNKKALFIPDIDKWEKWERSITEEMKKVDYAFIDATFFDANEIQGRNIKEIPHPFVVESMELFKDLSAKEKNKIFFIHFNHTNPLLREESPESQRVEESGFHRAKIHQQVVL